MEERPQRTIDWLSAAFEGRGAVDDATDYVPRRIVDQVGADGLVDTLATIGTGRRVERVLSGPVPAGVTFVLAGDDVAEPVLRVECVLDADGKVGGVSRVPSEHADLEVRTERTAELSPADRAQIHSLFEQAYEQANGSYLDASLATLRWITLATHGETLAGFSLGEQRVLDLPRVGATRATLAGLACVHPEMRRRGLFRRLSNLVLVADGVPDAARGPVLGAGRMAHPASYRVYRGHPTLVPTAGTTPNRLQQEVGAAVAVAYGVTDFDAERFVCRGAGAPIGYPKMTQEVEPDEWEVFAPVDRERGDALLAVIWQPTAPDGWLDAGTRGHRADHSSS